MRAKMTAMVLTGFKEPLTAQLVDRPNPGAGEVLVRVAASGVNPIDVKIQRGEAPHAKVEPPMILGADLAGTVAELGAGVTRFKVGDEVFGMTGGVGKIAGSLAEYTIADERTLAIKPRNISMRQAASLPLTFITAWEGLIDRAAVQAEQTVLVHAGMGGVGHLVLQLALDRGAKVTATVRASDFEYIRKLGARPIDYASATLSDDIARASEQRGFDIIYDTIGGETLTRSLPAARLYGGHVISCAGFSTQNLAPLAFRSGTFSGVFCLYPLLNDVGRAHQGEIMENARRLVEAEKIKPHLDERRFRLGEVNEAYAFFSRRENKGKIVIEI